MHSGMHSGMHIGIHSGMHSDMHSSKNNHYREALNSLKKHFNFRIISL